MGEAAPHRFAPGDEVRVKRLAPPGHVRTPHYLRGRAGYVAERVGSFGDPERIAYGRTAPSQPLYRVRFNQKHLWPDYAGAAEDTLVADLFESWLEPGSEAVG